MKFKKGIALLLLIVFLCTASGCANRTAPAETDSDTAAVLEVSDEIPTEYAYTLTVTINPEAKLYLDESDRIVGIRYLNEDAKTAYGALALVGSDLDTGLNVMIDSAIEKEFLKQDSPVSIELSEVRSAEDISALQKLEAIKDTVGSYITAKEDLGWTAEVKTDVTEQAAQTLATVEDDLTAQEEQEPAEPEDEIHEEPAEEEPVAAVCTRCNGTGNDCAECGGAGIVNCKACNNGFETCGTCNGSGVQRCNGCKGAGVNATDGQTCSYCGGAGTTTCEQCGGAGGYADCSWCHGTLHHICPICEGNQVCPQCNGTGLA